MKQTKRIMCSGLAFADKEDMEMLHRYALDGWVFKEFKGLHYILYKDEPQDLIFDYDMITLDENEKEDYFLFFKNAGWERIQSKECSVYFFAAPNGTPEVHTDREIQADRFRPIMRTSVIGCILGIIGIVVSLQFLNNINWALIPLLISTMLAATSMILTIGTLFRIKHRRIKIQLSFKTSCIILFISLITGILNQLIDIPNMTTLKICISAVTGGLFGMGIMGMISGCRQLRDRKSR